MRRIVVYQLVSLDGVAEDPDRFFADWDDAMDANLAAVIATQDAVAPSLASGEAANLAHGVTFEGPSQGN